MANPTLQFKVNNVDLSAYLVQNAWSVNQRFGRQGATARFRLSDDWTQTGTPHETVRPLQSVSLVDTGTGTTLFAGLVTTPTYSSVAPSAATWDLDCIDYTFYADNAVVSGDFTGQTADAIIKSLVSQANQTLYPSTNLTTNNVQPGPQIPRIQINYMTLSSALTRIAQFSSGVGADYGWRIDFNKDIHFQSLTQASAPSITIKDNATAAATATTGYIENDSLTYTWDGASVRNSCLVRGSNISQKTTDTWKGSGSQTAFPLTHHLDTSYTPTLTVGGSTIASLTVITTTDQTSSTAWNVTQNANGQWFLTSATAPVTGTVISFQYKYIIPIVARADNQSSQSTYGAVLQTAISDPNLNNVGSAFLRGQAILQEYQWVQERITLTVSAGFPGHFNAGDTIVVNTSRVPDSNNNWALGLNTSFLVLDNKYAGVQGNYRTYTFTAARVS